MSTHEGNGNGDDDLTQSEAVRRAASDLDSLVTDPGLRFVFHSLEARIQELADASIAREVESRKRSDKTDRLVQDCVVVANQAFGEAKLTRDALAGFVAGQTARDKLQVKMARTLGIDSPDSAAPPPMRERFDSLQGEVDLAELVAAEARAEAKAIAAESKAVAERAAKLEAEAKETRAKVEAAQAEASGAHKVAGEAKVLNAEVLKKLAQIAGGLVALTAAAWAIAQAMGAGK